MDFFPIQLTKLKLNQFRNHEKLDLDIDAQLVFFTGKNGVGKTSILEAISLANILKSFRTNSEKDIISWDHDFYTIDLEYLNKAGKNQLHIGYGGSSGSHSRSLFFNKEKIEKAADFIGKFQTVIFSPDDISIINTTPQARRNFVDMVISSLDRQYLKHLQRYRRILNMRSQMFKKSYPSNYDQTYFSSINRQITNSGANIQKKRVEFIEKFQILFYKYVAEISAQKDNWILKYDPSIKNGNEAEVYFENLQDSTPQDIRDKHTNKGIHRDRIRICLSNDKDMDLKQTASQGQKRTVVLALKMAQFDYVKSMTNETPVILIDDVLNEIDVTRRARFISFLNKIGQAFVTTTDLFGLENFINQKKKEMNLKIFQLVFKENKTILEEISI